MVHVAPAAARPGNQLDVTTVVKMTLVNVGPQVSAMSASAMGLVRCGRQGGAGRGVKMALFADILYG